MSNPEHLSQQHGAFVEKTARRIGYPAPAEVVCAALTAIEPDGAVFWCYDDETSEPVFFQPEELVALDELAPDSYSSRLFGVARAINGAVLHIERDRTLSDAPDMVQHDVQLLARYLSPYRHDPAFIAYAASLSTIDEHGALCGPTLPRGDPREWVPKLRAALAYQNAARESST